MSASSLSRAARLRANTIVATGIVAGEVVAASVATFAGASLLASCGGSDGANGASGSVMPFSGSSAATGPMIATGNSTTGTSTGNTNGTSTSAPSAATQTSSTSTSTPVGPGSETTPTPTQMQPAQMNAMQASTPACTPGSVTCDGPNTIATCNADGSGTTITRCDNGTNCQGAGQCMPIACNPGGVKPANDTYPASYNGNGQVTVYWFAQGTLSVPKGADQDVNCGFNASRANNDDGGQMDRVAYIQDPSLFGAMNGAEYGNANACGACVQMTQGGRNVTVTIADSCLTQNGNPSCTPGHIDLSRNAFQMLTGQSTGNIGGVTWKYVPCSGMGNIAIQLKKPDDQYWNEFIVTNHKYPLASAQIQMKDGTWVDATRQSDNNWRASYMGTDGVMGTYKVRIQDINGGVIEEQLALMGGLQQGHAQFECQ
jgi:expansin (peptidoglycan-binding protein)